MEQPTPSTTTHGPLWTSFEKLGQPLNKLLHKSGTESFWPTPLEQESEKAARILKSFCKEGIYTSQPPPALSIAPSVPHTLTNPHILLTIPPAIIQSALGLAIFTVARAGTWGASLACGSGVLVARKEDNTWSSPSGIIVNTLGLGFTAGVDIYDCVLVINTFEALEKFKGLRVSIGGELSCTAGPWGAGRRGDLGLGSKRGALVGSPCYSYIKSKGLYVGAQLDGTIIGGRGDENAKFYGQRVGVEGILKGDVGRWTGLEGVLRDVEVMRGLNGEVKQFPVIMEFDDRRGQRKGEDGVWRDIDVEKGEYHDEEVLLPQGSKKENLYDADSRLSTPQKVDVEKKEVGWKDEPRYSNDKTLNIKEKEGDEEWEDERLFYDLNSNRSPTTNNNDGEWEDERLFHINEPSSKKEAAPSTKQIDSKKQADEEEWEDPRLFDQLEANPNKNTPMWEKAERYA